MGHISKGENDTYLKWKRAHVKVKRGITRGENGALLALNKGHSPEMKIGTYDNGNFQKKNGTNQRWKGALITELKGAPLKF